MSASDHTDFLLNIGKLSEIIEISTQTALVYKTAIIYIVVYYADDKLQLQI